LASIGLLAAVVMALSTAGVFAQTQDPHVAYVGKWVGNWNGGLSQTIDIQTIDADGTMHGVASWGDKPEWHVKAGSAAFNHTKISADGKFSFPDSFKPGARADWVFNGGKLEGHRFETPGGNPTNTAVLVRGK
jgi:hypothetical protein